MTARTRHPTSGRCGGWSGRMRLWIASVPFGSKVGSSGWPLSREGEGLVLLPPGRDDYAVTAFVPPETVASWFASGAAMVLLSPFRAAGKGTVR